MNSYKFYMLTKDNCPHCNQLKGFLRDGLDGEFDSIIQRVHQDDDSELYKELVEIHGIMSVPALIRMSDEVVVAGFDPSRTLRLLENS